MLPAQPFAQLRSTPAGVLLLELDDGLLDLEGELAGMPVGPSGAIRQAIQPTVLVTTEDLVAGLAGDPELPAQHRHLLPVEPTGHKPKPFVHLVTLLPRHLRTPSQMPKSVTYVSGINCHPSIRKGTLKKISAICLGVPSNFPSGYR